MIFDTKIAILVQSDLQIWQKLNVTAFWPLVLPVPFQMASASHMWMRSGGNMPVCSVSRWSFSRHHSKFFNAHGSNPCNGI